MKINRIIFGVIALALFASCKDDKGQQVAQIPEYPTTVISGRNTVLESTFPVNIKGQEDIEIRPRIDGFIKAIYVDEGSPVRKGQSLFQIDSPQAEQGIRTAESQVSSAKAQLNTAALNVERMRPLAKDGIISQYQLDTYENAHKSALAGMAQAEAALKNAKSVIEWTNVLSPVDGVVGDIPFRLGSLVNSANVLTTVANTKEVYAYFSMNEKQLMEVLDGLPGVTQKEKISKLPNVHLRLANGTMHPEEGRVKTIAGQLNSATGTVLLRADFPNPQGVLRSGFSGNIIIPSAQEDVIVIQQKSTFAQQDKRLVYKLYGDSVVANLIEVVPTPDGKSFMVTNGLKVGDEIVEDGIITMRPGMKIARKAK